jgi:arylsulfatase A-like enzyme
VPTNGGRKDPIFLSFRKVQRSVRDDRWKLIRYPQIDHTQLFDLKNDPHEMLNLADDPAQADRVKQMLGLLKRSQQQVGDDLPLTLAKPSPKQIDMTGRKREPDRWQPEWIRGKYFGTIE